MCLFEYAFRTGSNSAYGTCWKRINATAHGATLILIRKKPTANRIGINTSVFFSPKKRSSCSRPARDGC